MKFSFVVLIGIGMLWPAAGWAQDLSLGCCPCPPYRTFDGHISQVMPEVHSFQVQSDSAPLATNFTLRRRTLIQQNGRRIEPAALQTGDAVSVWYYTNGDVLCVERQPTNGASPAPSSVKKRRNYPPPCQQIAINYCSANPSPGQNCRSCFW